MCAAIASSRSEPFHRLLVRRIDLERPLKRSLGTHWIPLIDADQSLLEGCVGEELLEVMRAQLGSGFDPGQLPQREVESALAAQYLCEAKVRFGAIGAEFDRLPEAGFRLRQTVLVNVDRSGENERFDSDKRGVEHALQILQSASFVLAVPPSQRTVIVDGQSFGPRCQRLGCQLDCFIGIALLPANFAKQREQIMFPRLLLECLLQLPLRLAEAPRCPFPSSSRDS